jgi:membrane-associated phospholipid phosphatase
LGMSHLLRHRVPAYPPRNQHRQALLLTPNATKPIVAYLINDGMKSVVVERRPCFTYQNAFLLEKWFTATDYSFPSNHMVVAAAMAAALWLINRRLGLMAAVAAAIMGLSRVYVGAHYPHDVAPAVVVGVVVGLATGLALRRYVTPLIEKPAAGRLRPVLTAETLEIVM